MNILKKWRGSMASREKLIGVSEYDATGDLDYFICGSQWLEWYAWRKERIGTNAEPSYAKAFIKQELMEKFEQAVDRALEMDNRYGQ